MPNRSGRFSIKAACAAAVVLACAFGTARASTLDGYQPEISVRAGTLGIGPELGIRIPQSPFGLRGNLNLFTYTDDSLYTHRFADAELLTGYDVSARFGGSVRLLNGGLTLDYYPLGSGLRLSAGLYGNGNRVTAQAVPMGTTRVGNQTYTMANAGNLSLKALVNSVAPYAGFGYSGHLSRHLVFAVDAGVLIEGDPRVSITTNGPAATLAAFTDQVERERSRIQHDIDVPVYPVLMLGVGYQF